MTTDEGIILRYLDGCPNWEVARARLTEALRALDHVEEIALERVETQEEALRRAFRGSPTILIDGVDPFTDDEAPAGLSCRVYVTERGMEGSPSVDQLIAALKERS